jgi:anti-sigma regulatory factor (Ser/Thr protein kinase)
MGTGPLDLRLAAEPSSARVARHALRRVAVGVLPPDRIDDACLAMSEAINNTILHAYRTRAHVGAAPVSVRIALNDATVEILVADRGVGFADGDRAPSTGLGAGLQLIDALADETRVLSGPTGTVVVMRFGPEWDPGRRLSAADVGMEP